MLVQNIIILVQNIIMLVPNIIVLVLASITSAIQGTPLIGPDCCRGKLDEAENLIYPRIPDTPYSTHFAQRNVIFPMEKAQLLRDLESHELRPGGGQCSDLRHQREGEYRPRGPEGKQDQRVGLDCYCCDRCRAESGC